MEGREDKMDRASLRRIAYQKVLESSTSKGWLDIASGITYHCPFIVII